MNHIMFFIVINRYKGDIREMLSKTPFFTFEEAQAVAAKIPVSWNATIVNTTNQGESK